MPSRIEGAAQRQARRRGVNVCDHAVAAAVNDGGDHGRFTPPLWRLRRSRERNEVRDAALAIAQHRRTPHPAMHFSATRCARGAMRSILSVITCSRSATRRRPDGHVGFRSASQFCRRTAPRCGTRRNSRRPQWAAALWGIGSLRALRDLVYCMQLRSRTAAGATWWESTAQSMERSASRPPTSARSSASCPATGSSTTRTTRSWARSACSTRASARATAGRPTETSGPRA